MDSLFLIDVKDASDDLRENVRKFREQFPDLPAIWTVTTSIPDDFYDSYGFQANRDQLFIKPDTQSDFAGVCDEQGREILDAIKDMGINAPVIAGVTYYGCVFGAYIEAHEMGLQPMIARDLTDYTELSAEDHAEAAQDWQARAPLICNSTDFMSGDGPADPGV